QPGAFIPDQCCVRWPSELAQALESARPPLAKPEVDLVEALRAGVAPEGIHSCSQPECSSRHALRGSDRGLLAHRAKHDEAIVDRDAQLESTMGQLSGRR